MELETYLKTSAAMSQSELAVALGISKGRVSQLKTVDDWPPELALKAEAATGGALDASRLSSVVAEARRTAA